jgi:hypothetical protein
VFSETWGETPYAMEVKILRPLLWFGLLEHRGSRSDHPATGYLCQRLRAWTTDPARRCQAIFRRRRHQPRRLPLAKIRTSPAPSEGTKIANVYA